MSITGIILAGLLTTAPPEPAREVLVVCPKDWRPSMQSWVDHRQRQGYRVRMVAPAATYAEQRAQINTQYRSGRFEALIVVGDVTGARGVSTGLAAATVSRRWGAPAQFTSDFDYGDPDGDGVPNFAVGRLPVDSASQLEQLLTRVQEYERQPPGQWLRRIQMVGGVGGFGPLVDGAVEASVKMLLAQGVPGGYRTQITHANWRSPFCPSLEGFRDHCLDRYNEGCLAWVYAGHGMPTRLDRIGPRPILSNDDVHDLTPQTGPPIAVLLACFSGDFAHDEEDCLAEKMLLSAGGPVALIAGTGVSMPYGTCTLTDLLLVEALRGDAPSLGACVLRSQKEMLDVEHHSASRAWLDHAAGLLGLSADERRAERAEHVRMFQLLGDPLLQVRRPAKVGLEMPARTVSGGSFQCQLTTPVAGEGLIELVCMRGQTRHPVPPRKSTALRTPQLQTAWDAEYVAANDDRWTFARQELAEGTTSITVDVPEQARGRCAVRVYVESDQRWAIGAAPVYVRRAGAAVKSAQLPNDRNSREQ